MTEAYQRLLSVTARLLLQRSYRTIFSIIVNLFYVDNLATVLQLILFFDNITVVFIHVLLFILYTVFPLIEAGSQIQSGL